MNFLLHLVNVFEHLYVAVSVCFNLPLPYCLRRFFVSRRSTIFYKNCIGSQLIGFTDAFLGRHKVYRMTSKLSPFAKYNV